MEQEKSSVLALNSGSSSIKFALYRLGETSDGKPVRGLHGKIERIGLRGTHLTFTDPGRHEQNSIDIGDFDHPSAANFLLDWLEKKLGLASIAAIGHRVANGGANYKAPQLVRAEMLTALRRISGYSPEHLPAEIELIALFGQRSAQLPQVACFDTDFHRDMPRVAKLLAIPRRYQAKGVERQGFHGLSCAYLMQELAYLAGTEVAQGRVILAHLGNGVSLTAVHGGRSMDTSMGFTPVAGLPMSTRSGDLDPGLVWYLAQTEHMSAQQFQHMINHESGMLGVSETSSDLRDLLAYETNDARAAEAVALFCYQVKKWIGAFAAALGGVDTLVFAGGIGENAAVIRARICEGLNFLDIALDASRNAVSAPIISAVTSRVTVRVMHTDEEAMIAQATMRILADGPALQHAHYKESI